MTNVLLKNATAVTVAGIIQNISIPIYDGKIGMLTSETVFSEINRSIDCTKLTVYAGFIDTHNHGAVGIDVNDGIANDVRKICEFLACKGVTAWLPTLVPDADENYEKAISAINEVMARQREEQLSNTENTFAARILGVHYEGVFANEKMCGALRPEFFKRFKNKNEISDLPKLSDSEAIHLTTLAPEIKNGIELIKELVRQNWTVSIGHTRADVETLNKAFAAGAKNVTHLFNAMTGAHHRDLGVAGWALTNDNIFCEIIADGIHVAPPMLKLAFKNKTAERLALVSDSVAPTGLGDGDFELWGETISVENGKTKNERGSIAGSVITMLDAVQLMIRQGIPIEDVSKMASLTPAKMLGIDDDYGSIEIGKRADLVAIDDEGNVKLTIVGGRIAFEDL